MMKQRKNVDREKLTYETNEYAHSFKTFQTIKIFGRDIYEGNITLEKANEYHVLIPLGLTGATSAADAGIYKKN